MQEVKDGFAMILAILLQHHILWLSESLSSSHQPDFSIASLHILTGPAMRTQDQKTDGPSSA